MAYLDFTGIYSFIDSGLSLTESGAWKYSLSMSDVRNEIIRMNQEQLYEEGEDSKGGFLGLYRPFTIVKKLKNSNPKGRRVDHITLYDQGRFYASMRVNYDSNSFEVTADDSTYYDTPLFELYGRDIVGLNSFNLHRLKLFITKYYYEYIEQTLLR